MFARTIHVEVESPGSARACRQAWLDSYCMRSFTGREAFDETLPFAGGLLEVSFQVDANALRVDVEDWFTRKFGEGKAVQLQRTERTGS